MSKLKRFNKVINIEISVDSIAEKLMETIKEDNPHKEIIVNAIIGNLEAEGRLGQLYNSLNGWEDKLDFEVGQMVNCIDTIWDYTENDDIDGVIQGDSTSRPIGVAKIIEINEYSNNRQLKLEYEILTKKGDSETRREWVHHKRCEAIVHPE